MVTMGAGCGGEIEFETDTTVFKIDNQQQPTT